MLRLSFAGLARLVASLLLLVSTAATAVDPDPVAVVGGRPIPHAALVEAVAPQLAQLDAQRAQVLADGLKGLVADRLVELEAARQSVPVADLLAGIDAQVAPIEEAQIAAFYQQNQARIRRPLDGVRDAIRQHLEGEGKAAARARWIEELTARFGVETRLEPYRVAVDNQSAPVRGPATAEVEVTVFSDYECPWCRKLEPTLGELAARFPTDVRVAFRHLPLTGIHPRAEPAALAAVCAAEQQRFWPFHDLLFADGSSLDPDGLASAASRAGLDLAAWNACRESPAARDLLAADLAAAGRLGIASTPSIFVNGRPVTLVAARPTLDQLADVVREEIALKKRS